MTDRWEEDIMQVPLEITFRDVPRTSDIDRLIQEHVERLESSIRPLISCRIAVERPHKHPRSGSPYRVRVDMRAPHGHELVVSEEPGDGDLHDELDTVLRRVFDACGRELRKLKEKQHQEVKSHPAQDQTAIVARLIPDEGYGFLRIADEREVYFHRNSVLDGRFGELEAGTGVRYVLEMGDKGLQASTVQIVEKPGSGVEHGAGDGRTAARGI